MKKYTYILFLIFASMTISSCNDWLNVKPDTQVEEDDMFKSYQGYRSALTGCYMTLGSTSIYGQRLTMTNIESLADLWYMTDASVHADDYHLMNHEYTQDDAKTAIKYIYGELFNTIVQANMIIKHIDNTTVIESETKRKMIEGEAYAIRALCQMDVLRLFGQMPQNATKQVSLPYSETTSINEMPAYYSFADYVAKLKADFEKAASLLKDSDPIFGNTFKDLNSPSSTTDDTFTYYRQFRLNYWAVMGMQARLYLYLGDTTKAHELAMSIINAKGADGNSLMPLSGVSDLTAGYFNLPTECLFSLSKYNILTYTSNYFIGNGTSQVRVNAHYCVNNSMFNSIFQGANVSSNNRYLYVWNNQAKTSTGIQYPTITKYYYDTSTSSSTTTTSSSVNMVKHQVIPMLRMSEIYLIALETSTDLSEANSLYKTYMESQNELITSDKFASLDEVKSIITSLYLREFYGEGVMFYTYKRMATSSIQMNYSQKVEMGEDQYVIPLPESEYDPATLNK
jgi:hypothetical protein